MLVVAPSLGVRQGAIAKRSTPEAFDKTVHEEITTRMKVWKAAGVKVE